LHEPSPDGASIPVAVRSADRLFAPNRKREIRAEGFSMFDSPRMTGYHTLSLRTPSEKGLMAREMEAAGAEAGEPRTESRAAGTPGAPAQQGARRGLRPAQPSPREEELMRARQVARPVALLALIERMENWKVDDDLIAAVVEAAEAGIQIDSLYEAGGAALDEAEEKDAARPTATATAPIPVYRLGDNTLIHFGKDGKPIGPPIQYFFSSKLGSENVFGCELAADAMISDAPPFFRRGDTLIFSIDRKVESGDLAFIKTRNGDEFVQVFFQKDDAVRLRSLNARYPERTLRRAEIKVIFKLVGRYQEL
jgi:hypothetical protein